MLRDTAKGPGEILISTPPRALRPPRVVRLDQGWNKRPAARMPDTMLLLNFAVELVFELLFWWPNGRSVTSKQEDSMDEKLKRELREMAEMCDSWEWYSEAVRRIGGLPTRERWIAHLKKIGRPVPPEKDA